MIGVIQTVIFYRFQSAIYVERGPNALYVHITQHYRLQSPQEYLGFPNDYRNSRSVRLIVKNHREISL